MNPPTKPRKHPQAGRGDAGRGTGFGMRGAEQAVVHLKICLACVQISNSRVRVPKQHPPACVAGAGPLGAAATVTATEFRPVKNPACVFP